jgi:hypothetical protein
MNYEKRKSGLTVKGATRNIEVGEHNYPRGTVRWNGDNRPRGRVRCNLGNLDDLDRR